MPAVRPNHIVLEGKIRVPEIYVVSRIFTERERIPTLHADAWQKGLIGVGRKYRFDTEVRRPANRSRRRVNARQGCDIVPICRKTQDDLVHEIGSKSLAKMKDSGFTR